MTVLNRTCVVSIILRARMMLHKFQFTTKPKGWYCIELFPGNFFLAPTARVDSRSSPVRETDTRHSFFEPFCSKRLKHMARTGGNLQIRRVLWAFFLALQWGHAHSSARSSCLQNSSKHWRSVAFGFVGRGSSSMKKLSKVLDAYPHDLQVMVDSSWPIKVSVKIDVWDSTASFHWEHPCSSIESLTDFFSISFTTILWGDFAGVVTMLALDWMLDLLLWIIVSGPFFVSPSENSLRSIDFSIISSLDAFSDLD